MTHSRLSITTAVERFPIRGQFRISRGAKTEAEVVTCRVSGGGFTGIGECVPYRRYGETVESVRDQIAGLDALSLGDNPREALRAAMKPGAARNALDCAFWDLEAKTSRVPAHSLACRLPPRPVPTALTISLDTPANMAEAARAAADRPLLKIKVDGEKPVACMHAVASSAPRARIIVDANEAWDENTIVDLLRAAAEMHIALIEQPLPAGQDAILRDIPHPVPICADESAHTSAELEPLRGLYDAVNIKLDKTGGLTEALAMRDAARAMGFGIMVGCMVGTSLAMAPAVLLAQDADYVDLDGPLLLERDRHPGLTYTTALVSPPEAGLWG